MGGGVSVSGGETRGADANAAAEVVVGGFFEVAPPAGYLTRERGPYALCMQTNARRPPQPRPTEMRVHCSVLWVLGRRAQLVTGVPGRLLGFK